MDKYFLIILMFLIAGMIIAATSDPFIPGLFYSMMGGSILIVVYTAMKDRKEKQAKNRERRRRSKK